MSKLADLEEALEALSSLVGERSFCELSPRELVATGKAVGGLRRRVDAVFAEWSAEMSRQSAPDLGSAGLARVEGFKTPEDMISTTAGVPAQEARKLVKVGTARAPQRDISGDVVPPRFPHLTTAMDQHLLSVENAHLILTMLEKVYVRADKAELMQVEKELVARAATLSPKDVRRLVAQAEALLDPRGVEHKLEHHRENRKLVITEYDGQLRIEFAADVVTGAPVKAAIEGIVTATLQRQAHRDEAPEDQRGPEDHRSAGQIRADALVEIATHALGCTQVPSKPTATVVVRMTLEQLHEGTGMATIDGTDLPVPVERARCLAAELQVIPMVLGGKSEILDYGRARRLFTPAQKLALTERDRGCVNCGAPPEQCITHHLQWWSHGGTTDLSNGVLLCTSCHTTLHTNGYDIYVDGDGVDAQVWWIPPASHDPSRTPRLAGAHRYHLAA